MKARNTETNKNIQTIVFVDCNTCGSNTRHMIQASYYVTEQEGANGYTELGWDNFFQIVECQGCQEVSFRRIHTNSEDIDFEDEYVYTKYISIYPKRTHSAIKEKAFTNIPSIVKKIYRETINSYNNDVLMLCGAGVRALVEAICKEKGITEGMVTNSSGNQIKKNDLFGKIHGLYQNGILTEAHANILHEHRFLGNKALHELSAPTKEKLRLAIDIIENTLMTIYEVPKKGETLKNNRLGNNS